MHDEPEFMEGVEAAIEAFAASRTPRESPWQDQAPAYVAAGGHRAYLWMSGYSITWNGLAGKKCWPDWTRMRCTWKAPSAPPLE